MAWFAFAVPIPSGKTEAWRTVSSEFMGSRREDFLGHIDRLGLTRQEWWIQAGPEGDVLVVANEGAEPEQMIMKFAESDHPFDDEWAQFILRNLGFDLKNPPSPPEHIGAWTT